MSSRLSLDRLLKVVVLAFSAGLIILTCMNLAASWRAWQRSEQAQAVVAASRHIFTALANMRTDRSSMQRSWEGDEGLTPVTKTALEHYQGSELAALDAAVKLLDGISFDSKDRLLPEMHAAMDQLAELRQAFWSGVGAPKSTRQPASLGKDYADTSIKLQGVLEKISAQLFAQVKTGNPYISQMLTVEQAAWTIRNTVGEGSLLISVGLAKGHVAPDVLSAWSSAQGGGKAVWAMIDGAIFGLDVTDSFRRTLADAEKAMFDPDYITLQKKLIDELLTGKTPSMITDAWSARTVPILNLMVKVADGALEQAAVRASRRIDAARDHVIWQGVLLLASLAAAAGGFLFVTRRVTSPLLRVRAATERLAAGDFTATAEVADHDDEIGSIAAALATFRQQAIEKVRLEEEQAGARQRAEQRQVRIDGHIGDFRSGVATALQALEAARSVLGSTAGEMIHIAERGASGVHDAERATSEASDNVSGIAAATEELSASISEIARQVEQAARVSLRAVEETQQTDETVRGLAESALRIGEVVGLISNIAAQTNLLALNATIEAARAGEAGKGFAVVASEVKSLANQTAKATEEIGKQITSVRTVTQDAVKAISQIRGTIDEVNVVATSIASAIEEQGAAMQEIARNTQQAADRTRQASGSVTAVSTETEATTASAAAVKTAAASLGTEAEHLREQIDTFMERLRAA